MDLDFSGGPWGARPEPTVALVGGITLGTKEQALLSEPGTGPFQDHEELRELLGEAQERGYLTLEEVATAVDTLDDGTSASRSW